AYRRRGRWGAQWRSLAYRWRGRWGAQCGRGARWRSVNCRWRWGRGSHCWNLACRGRGWRGAYWWGGDKPSLGRRGAGLERIEVESAIPAPPEIADARRPASGTQATRRHLWSLFLIARRAMLRHLDNDLGRGRQDRYAGRRPDTSRAWHSTRRSRSIT